MLRLSSLMSDDRQLVTHGPSTKARWGRRPWRAALIIAAVGVGILLIALASVVPFSSETARLEIIAMLASRLDGEVQLDSLQMRVLPRLHAEGSGLAIRHKGRHDVPPLISIRRFSVEGSVFELLRKHVSKLTVEGLDIVIPPRHDADTAEEGTEPDQSNKDVPRARKSPRIVLPRAWVVDELVSSGGRFVTISHKPNKPPKVWDIHDLRMRSVSFDRPMPFDAILTNAVPPGEITTTGTFGPWQREEPGQTPLDGTFTFDRADLSVFKGIAGILSAHGTFGGELGRIDIHGDTNTPQFTVTHSGHPVPLQAKYHAIVDGTNGDTTLERVDGHFLSTSLVARGDIVDLPGKAGRKVTLDVTMDKARLEDVLRLAVKSPEPPMTGALKLKTRFILPPGHQDVIEKLLLDGTFTIADASFTKLKVQQKINELSRRSRGEAANKESERVTSNFTGTFKLENGTLSIPEVTFDIPGSVVQLSGTYNLEAETLNFRGMLSMDAKISEMTSGFKRVLLKVVDPIFKRKGGGSEIPIKISGPRKNPSFGLDTGRLFKGNP